MQTINYETGRNYGKPQILAITIESETIDEFDLRDIVATFRDDARNISGRVSLVLFSGDNLGKSVLSAYDAGRYQSL
jgi:hypothetical protein